MRNKRLFAIVVAFALLFTQMNFMIVSAEEPAEVAEPLYSETELAFFESKLEMLLDLGIFPKMDKEADATISRAEFAGIMEKVLGKYLYEASFEENPYVDVKELTSNATAIIALKKMGLMVGVNNVEFKPESKVTYAQAIKVVLSGLGYKDLAEIYGGYYTGYLKKAIDLGILRPGAADFDRALTMYDAVTLIDAIIDAEVPVLVSMDVASSTFVDSKDLDLLSVCHDIYEKKGVMTDNGLTALNGESASGIGTAVIDGVKMLNVAEKFTDLIGRRVVAYYREGSVKELLHAYTDTARNNILTIDAYDLVKDSGKFSKSRIVYKNENGKEKEAKVSIYADLIYNGSAFPPFVGETLKIPTGTLTLIDTNLDNEYETIVAETFDDYLVKTVNTVTGAIYSNYADPILYSKYKVVHFYNLEGEEVELADIKNDSLISVYKSKDYTKLIVYICEQKSSMVLDNVVVDENGLVYIEVGENTYRLGEWYMSMMDDENSNLKVPVAGAKYTVYINVLGEAGMFQEVQLREEYAYLLDVGINGSEALKGSKPEVKIVNEQGDCVIVKAAKKFTVIDSKGTYENDSNAVIKSADLYNTSGNFVPQLIRIKINSKGEFTKIEYDNTTITEAEAPYGFNESKFNKIFSGSASTYSGYSSKNLGGKYIIDKDTKIFLIEEPGSLTTTDETKVKVCSYSEFKLVGIQATIYDTDQNWAAGAIVCCSTATSYDDRTFTVIDSKVVTDEFGDERYQVTGYWKNNVWTFREHYPGVFEAALKEKGYKGIKRGDVFLIQFDNEKQEITKTIMVMSPQRDDTQIRKGFGPYSTTSYESTIWGQVIGYPISGTDGSIGILANGEYYVETTSSATYVTIFDTTTGEITKGDRTRIPTIGNVDKYGNIDIGDGSVMIYGFRQRQHLCDILIVLK